MTPPGDRRASRIPLALRSLLFTALLPGTVTLLIPWLLAVRGKTIHPAEWAAWRFAGLLPLAAGSVLLAWCIVDFAMAGRGTLAPVDPPRNLVVRGPYRAVRNPMYAGVLAILAGEALLLGSTPLLFYAAVAGAGMHLFVVLCEEPALRGQFGASYAAYCRNVHRWVPRRPSRPPA